MDQNFSENLIINDKISKKKSSRRLQHRKINLEIFVKTPVVIKNIEQMARDTVTEHVHISQKNRLLGKTKLEELKRICINSNIEIYKDGYKIALLIHLQFYSAVYFDKESYIVDLNVKLNLNPNSIKLLEFGKEKKNKNTIVIKEDDLQVIKEDDLQPEEKKIDEAEMMRRMVEQFSRKEEKSEVENITKKSNTFSIFAKS